MLAGRSIRRAAITESDTIATFLIIFAARCLQYSKNVVSIFVTMGIECLTFINPLRRVFCYDASKKGGIMAWQGIPFPLQGTLGLLIEKIPHLDITTNSGWGWDTIVASAIGAFIAAAIPALIAWWSIRNNNRTLQKDRSAQFRDFERSRDTQIRIADESRKAQIIASNRLVWIKDLREASAEFVSSAYDNLTLSQRVVMLFRAIETPSVSKSDKDELNASLGSVKKETHSSFVKLVLHATRIQMMLNPERPEHLKVISAMNNIKLHSENMIKTKSDMDGDAANTYLNEFVRDMQRLLKEEWEKAKNNI